MTIIIFIAVLLVTVLVHEWGHFFAARKSGMTVEEFGFGIPPRLWSWKKGETKYSLNALPIGGFVKIAGENGIEAGIPKERQFESKPWYAKSIVLIAGVLCNILLAIVLFTIAYTSGLPGITETGTPTVISIVEGGSAAKAGIVTGDTVQSVVVDDVHLQTLNTSALHDAIQKSHKPIVLTYTDSVHAVHTATLTPTLEGDSKLIGIAIEPIGTIREPIGTAFVHAVMQSGTLMRDILKTLGTVVHGLFSGHKSDLTLVGPVGLAKEVGTAATFGLTYLLAFVATISLNLAVLNIMPFPALDGGRLLVVLLEAITKRKFSPTVVGIIHAAGFLILITIMIVLTVGDVKRVL